LYLNSTPPIPYPDYEHDTHGEEMRDLATGLIGAVIRLHLHSASGPEFGSRIPLLVTYVPGDIIRIYVDPEIETYGKLLPVPNRRGIKKAREHVTLTALSYQGEQLRLDTESLPKRKAFPLATEIQFQMNTYLSSGE